MYFLVLYKIGLMRIVGAPEHPRSLPSDPTECFSPYTMKRKEAESVTLATRPCAAVRLMKLFNIEGISFR